MPPAFPPSWNSIQRNLHLFGRYGITMFAISGLDIALVGSRRKVKGVPLHRLIGDAQAHADSGLCEPAADRDAGTGRERVPMRAAARAIGAIKLHETTAPAVLRRAARRSAPASR